MTLEDKLKELERLLECSCEVCVAKNHATVGQLLAIARLAIEQRDGFMINYHASNGVNMKDRRLIHEDANAALLAACGEELG